MLLNLSDVFKEQGKVIHRDVDIDMTAYEEKGNAYSLREVSKLSLVLTNLEVNRVRIQGTAELVFAGACDRCLTEVLFPMKLSVDRIVVPQELFTEDDEEVDDLSFLEGFYLNTEVLLHNEIMENWPAKILCKEDCKGICPVCGENRNVRDCGCDTFVPDPRMAAIQDVFNACKEV